MKTDVGWSRLRRREILFADNESEQPRVWLRHRGPIPRWSTRGRDLATSQFGVRGHYGMWATLNPMLTRHRDDVARRCYRLEPQAEARVMQATLPVRADSQCGVER